MRCFACSQLVELPPIPAGRVRSIQDLHLGERAADYRSREPVASARLAISAYVCDFTSSPSSAYIVERLP
jgi:hypothetical protein